MKENTNLKILCLLIIILIGVLCWVNYDNFFINNKEEYSNYALSTYEIDVSNFNFVNKVINNKKVYLLYNLDDYFLVKEIDILNNKVNNYSKALDKDCKLQNEDNYPYIYCSDNNYVTIYDIKFNKLINQNIKSNYNYVINTDGSNLSFEIGDYSYSYQYINGYYKNTIKKYVELETPYTKDIYCDEYCLYIRYNDVNQLISLYNDTNLLETNISNYGLFEKGIFTYNENKIKIHDVVNDEYKEFNSPINNLSNKLITLGTNYYLYVLNGNKINVYNLYTDEIIENITLNTDYDINEIVVNYNNLYVFTDNVLFVYDIFNIEGNNVESSFIYEERLINDKINGYKNNYGVYINIYDDPSYLDDQYNVYKLNNYNDIINALEELEDYFKIFNYDFFNRFNKNNFNGFEIYLVSGINVNNSNYNSVDVVGLFTLKNNKYIIAIDVSDIEDVKTIACHETMHAIEYYLNNNKIYFNEWNSYNPYDFSYNGVYYTNRSFYDTLDSYKFNEDVYFVDNYARSNVLEDRARTFETICRGEDYSKYPNLNAKIDYLKNVILSNFPELYFSSYFNN